MGAAGEPLEGLAAKPKLGYAELIAYMKAKGIRFELCSEEEALAFIRNDTFYARTTPFAHLFERLPDGTYVDLDFASVRDLYGIDLAMRRVLIEAALDIEHFLKLRMMDILTERDDEDGYSIVDAYWAQLTESQKRALKNDLDTHAARNTIEASPWLSGAYLDELLARYELDMPMWVFLQLAFFSTTVYFNGFCGRRWGIESMVEEDDLLHDIKSLRNLCAHGNAVLDVIDRTDSREPDARVLEALVAGGADRTVARSQLSCRRVREICSLFWCYGEMGRTGTRHTESLLDDMEALWARAGRNPDYYEGAELVSGRLAFLEQASRILMFAPLGR